MTQNYKPAYPPEFRQQMVELVALGKCPKQLSREFGATTLRYKPGVEQQVYQLDQAKQLLWLQHRVFLP